ncbi:MAG TPA: sigma-70 family RNA polymerase sigma factor [Gemmatimonadales bacterium]|nr:sigma-70 family RNA polymerase sigma factor [Gemmatimonadales bacterium]
MTITKKVEDAGFAQGKEECMPAGGSMSHTRSGPQFPAELTRLLDATDETTRQAAWSSLVKAYSRLLLHFAHALGGDHDTAMDRYVFMLERLSQDDFRRLRTYRCEGAARFSTWLGTVARRLCIDYQRSRYGRTRAGGGNRGAWDRLAQRRALVRLTSVGDAGELGEVPDPNAADPAHEVCAAELRAALSGAVADLDPTERQLLAHWFEDRMSAAEIARRLGYDTPLQVYRRVHSACARIRTRLAARGIREALP